MHECRATSRPDLEAIYDADGRVVRFREYERGVVIRSESYRYGPEGELLERRVERPGGRSN